MRKRTKMALKVVIVLVAMVLYIMYKNRNLTNIEVGNLTLSLESRLLKVVGRAGSIALTGEMGLGLSDSGHGLPVDCSDSDETCLLWKDVAKLTIRPSTVKNAQCHVVQWESLTADHKPKDCFRMEGAKWFGGSESFTQRWPINAQRLPFQQYRSVDYMNAIDQHGSILEPYWFSSNGIALYVQDDKVPLHVGVNGYGDGRICLGASYEGSSTAMYKTHGNLDLSYVICQSTNAKEIHRVMAERFLDRPTSLPDELMLKSPVWSTWARYKTHVNQESVMEYASEIEKYDFPNSQIEIDDMYTMTYGDFDFDLRKFPDPKKMTDELHERGFRVTSWITPFANLDSDAYKEGSEKGYWVTDATGRVPGLVKWWQGIGAVLDVTNPEAADWYVQRLDAVRKTYGIDSFKFDAGEVGHLPPFIGTHVPLENPNLYTTRYADAVAHFGGMAEMRAAYRMQKYPFFVRMMDKDSVWGFNNGLETMIPTALMMSMTGYHYILPDMIGGNGYGTDDPLNDSALPDRELFVRWVQLSAYLPAMQFSFTPWQYDKEIIDISREMVKVHQERVTPIFLRASKDMLASGVPIIRPIWWLAPTDEEALAMESEFLVADEILVAPILALGARARDIYLPEGRWKDDLRGQEILGKTWLRDYKAGLDEIPTFTYLSKSA